MESELESELELHQLGIICILHARISIRGLCCTIRAKPRMICNAKNSGDTTLLVIPNSGSVLTITNQNVIILCGFTTQTFSTNDIRLIRINILLQNFLHMCNISIIYRQTFRLMNYTDVVVNSLHQLRLWPTAADGGGLSVHFA